METMNVWRANIAFRRAELKKVIGGIHGKQFRSKENEPSFRLKKICKAKIVFQMT